jgi:ParB-like chromosome segregation protein Spo0J
MASKKNAACTLSVRQIEKSPILALGMSQKDVRKYEKVASVYGNITPAIVGMSGNTYHLLDGQARLEACAHSGFDEMPVIVAQASGDAEQMKLALLLSTIREEGGAISEGVFIDRLITCHGVSRRELTKLLGKSKAWLSKRQSLANNLSDVVQGMVTDGTLYTRTAEEIAKIPKESQAKFAGNVVKDQLSKTEVERLVSLYRDENTSQSCRETILEDPVAVLPETVLRRPAKRKDSRSEGEKIAATARYAIRLIGEMGRLIAVADSAVLLLVTPHLSALREAMADLALLLSAGIASVSPGEPQRGQSQ